MEGFLDHIDEAYATESDGFFAGASLRYSQADPEKRRLVGEMEFGGKRSAVVLNARPVGGRNAGAFRGWVTVSRAEWRRITGPRPAGWRSFTVMIGFAPDDETVWWSSVFDDDILRTLDPEEMEDGRWLRLSPEDAAVARVAEASMLQQTLGLAEEHEPPVVLHDDVLMETIHAGLSVLLDDNEMKHVGGPALVAMKRRLLLAVANVDKWREVRAAQSYSQQKAAAARR